MLPKLAVHNLQELLAELSCLHAFSDNFGTLFVIFVFNSLPLRDIKIQAGKFIQYTAEVVYVSMKTSGLVVTLDSVTGKAFFIACSMRAVFWCIWHRQFLFFKKFETCFGRSLYKVVLLTLDSTFSG